MESPGKYIRTPEIIANQHKALTGRKLSDEHKASISRASRRLGLKPPILSGSSNGNWKGGLPKCLDCGKELSMRIYKRCKSCSRVGSLNVNYKKEPSKCSNWKGGVTGLYQSLRNLIEYRRWRSNVIKRDGYECSVCSTRSRLTAHHIVSLYQIISDNKIIDCSSAISCSQLWDESNGITLCHDCHKKVHDNIGWKIVYNFNVL